MTDRTKAVLETINDIVRQMDGVQFGYVGNLERWGDDRSWSISLAHPGRPGEWSDLVGPRVATEEIEQLLPIVTGMHAAYLLAKNGIEADSDRRYGNYRKAKQAMLSYASKGHSVFGD